MKTIFLISPARCSGPRAEMLVSSRTSAMGAQLRTGDAALGEVFTWLSALYFRGKLTYAQTFAKPPPPLPGSLVMAPGLGLRSPEMLISADDLRTMGTIAIESEAFVRPLRRDADLIKHASSSTGTRVVVLGSIATGKYLATLLDVFGTSLVFPDAFVGRGDMSRGGLMLRSSRTGDELTYVPVHGTTLHGARPPRLPKLHRGGPR
jgi:hypothetical protein